MSDGGTPLRIVIVGSGVAGASVAAALSTALPKQRYAITLLPVQKLVDDEDAVVATTPSVRNFHARLNLDDASVVRSCWGSFTLGIAHSGWSATRPTFFLPYGDIGATLDGVPFHQQVARLQKSGEAVRPSDYSLAIMLAQAGRFTLPSTDGRSVLSTFSYGLHLPREAYAALLLDIARANGALVHESVDPTELRRNQRGAAEAVLGRDGREIVGDLFIDATGPAALLRSMTSENDYEDWSETFGCDRVLRLRCRTTSPPSPYSHIEAHSCGWRSTVPAAEELGETFAFASEFVSDDEAETSLRHGLHGAPMSEMSSASLISRRVKLPWKGNCIAVGSAAATPEPGQSSLELVHASIERLLQLIPVTAHADVEAREYNRLTMQELDRARDMSAARFLLNGRSGEPFWDRLRARRRSEELTRKVTEFTRRGRVPLADGDRRDEAEWATLLKHLGLHQQRYDILADTISTGTLTDLLGRMRRALIDAAAGVPFHGEYLEGLRRKPAA